MVLLIDANIILDVLLNRSEFVRDSSIIWKLCETGQIKGYIIHQIAPRRGAILQI